MFRKLTCVIHTTIKGVRQKLKGIIMLLLKSKVMCYLCWIICWKAGHIYDKPEEGLHCGQLNNYNDDIVQYKVSSMSKYMQGNKKTCLLVNYNLKLLLSYILKQRLWLNPFSSLFIITHHLLFRKKNHFLFSLMIMNEIFSQNATSRRAVDCSKILLINSPHNRQSITSVGLIHRSFGGLSLLLWYVLLTVTPATEQKTSRLSQQGFAHSSPVGD